MHNKNERPAVQTVPYGLWTSPITAAMTTRVEKSNRNCDIFLEGETLYWTEVRPNEKSRVVIVKREPSGATSTIIPQGYDVRSKVHEYGGLAFTVIDQVVYFVNAKDQRLYAMHPSQEPTPLTATGIRYADLLPSPEGIIAVAEERHQDKVSNFLVLIDIKTGSHTILDEGHDFYASPALGKDGRSLAWLTWDHPSMPWDGTELWTAELSQGQLIHKMKKAGGASESIFQPQWSPQGNLFFVSDCTGWWNLYKHDGKNSVNVCPMSAEFGLPLWRLGISTWRFTGKGEEIVCAFQQNGEGKLAFLNPQESQLRPISLPFTDFSQVVAGKNKIFCLMGTPTEARRLILLDTTSLKWQEIDRSEKLEINEGYLAAPETIVYPSAQNRTAYGYFYPPKNKDYTPPADTLPPLIIVIHGGPTATADPIFNLRIQYWTSRGFAVFDVNYAGSTGYGRKYRDSLKGLWGVADVEDCIAGARYLAEMKKVDPKKIFIRGGSAGGFTSLAALAHSDIFAAGASYYGVADLELLQKDTHKFEAHYLDSLIGPYPEKKALYKERSPLFNAESISSPVIFFQGGEDPVVPKNQTEAMFEALQKRKIISAFILYEKEEHGFRQPENVQDSLEKELQFYLATTLPHN